MNLGANGPLACGVSSLGPLHSSESGWRWRLEAFVVPRCLGSFDGFVIGPLELHPAETPAVIADADTLPTRTQINDPLQRQNL
jgi:hypothetical protein